MERKYSVFVSSTYEDLKDERHAVLRTILDLGYMPLGMELFPATDDTSWNLIRKAIDNSDYYVVIVGGRYGSVDETNLSYTEREHNYAAPKIPVLAFLHEAPDNLPRNRTEADSVKWERLNGFREKLKSAHFVKFWHSAEDLQAKAASAIASATLAKPMSGWIRASSVVDVVRTLPSRTHMYDEILGLMKSARRSIADTTWGADAPSPTPAAAKKRAKYIALQEEAAKRVTSGYREIFSQTDGKAKRIARAVTMGRRTKGAYDAKIVGHSRLDPPLVDFGVFDTRHVVLSHVRSHRHEGHRFVYVDSEALALFFEEWFDEIWAHAKTIRQTASPRGPTPVTGGSGIRRPRRRT